MTNEIWKDIPGYEGLYQVSNRGNVKSLARFDPENPHGSRSKERILKFDITEHNSTSYARVTLSKYGTTIRFLVHRLVALVFIPNPDNKPFINHIDNNGLNNSIENLEWVTPSENMEWSAVQNRQDTCRQLGIDQASKKAQQRAENRWKARLGNNFISTYMINDHIRDRPVYSRYVCYRCKCCGGIQDSPAKSKSLSDLNGLCECCFSQKLSQFMENLKNSQDIV